MRSLALVLFLALLPTSAYAVDGTDELLSDAERVPPSIIFVIDRSGQMNAPCVTSGTESCLTTVKNAIMSVMRHVDWARFGVVGTQNAIGSDKFYPIAPVGSTYAEITAGLNALTGSNKAVRNLTEVIESLDGDYLRKSVYEDYEDDDGDGFTGDWAESPDAYSCSRTHIIVLTRERPMWDDQVHLVPRYATVTPDIVCDAAGTSAIDTQCLYDNDLSNVYNQDHQSGVADTQRMIVHTISLGTQSALAESLWVNAQAQTAGEGTYSNAGTAQEVLASILSALNEIQSGIYTRSTPIVTTDGNHLIYDFYEVVGDNPLAQGHVRAYQIDNDPTSGTYGQVMYEGPTAYGGAVWDGGDLLVSRPVTHAEQNPDDRDGIGPRDIYTYESGAATVLSSEAATNRSIGFDSDFAAAVAASPSAFTRYFDSTNTGTAAATSDPYNLTYLTDGDSTIDEADLQALIDFVRGLPTAKFRYLDITRGSWKLGDSPYAVPVVVSARNDVYSTDPTYRRFLEAVEADGVPSVVIVPANDGMLHAFALQDDGSVSSPNAGEELWAWVPGYLLTRDRDVEWSNGLIDLMVYGRTFLFDATPVVEDVWIDGNGDGIKASDGSEWRRVLVVQQGLGGPDTLALDITDTATPRYLWEQQNTTDYTAMGYTVGRPSIINVYDTAGVSGHDRWVAMWGGGRAAAFTGASGTNYYQSVEANLYMWNIGTDVWGTESRTFDVTGSNVGTMYQDLTTWGGNESTSTLDMGTDTSHLEHSYIAAALAAVDVDGDGDHDVVYFPVTSAYRPQDLGGGGVADTEVPGETWMYKAILNSAAPDAPTWVPWFDPKDGTVDRGYGNGIAARPEIFYKATAAWRNDGSLGIYFGSGSPFDREDATDRGYFFALYDDNPLSSTSTAKAIDCDGNEGYYELDLAEGLTSEPLVYAGVVYFSTYTPNADRCEAGTGRVYGLRYDDCSPGIDTNGDGTADASDDAAVETSGYVSGVTVSSYGTIYYGSATPTTDGSSSALETINAATDPFLGTVAVAWMEIY